jgi:hypothetical protein
MRRRNVSAAIGGAVAGSATGWSAAARAQQRAVPLIGLLSSTFAKSLIQQDYCQSLRQSEGAGHALMWRPRACRSSAGRRNMSPRPAFAG